jgi:hypothetical protein
MGDESGDMAGQSSIELITGRTAMAIFKGFNHTWVLCWTMPISSAGVIINMVSLELVMP